MPRGALKKMLYLLYINWLNIGKSAAGMSARDIMFTLERPNSLKFQFFSSLTTEGIIGKVTMTDLFVHYSSYFHVLGLIKPTLTTIYNSKCLTDPV